jgi:hypothetical protein
MKTLCEWNPAREEIVWTTGGARIGCHEPAAISLGRYGEWHLCEGCAKSSVFAHFRERSILTALLYTARYTKSQPSETRATENPHARETKLATARQVSSSSVRAAR